MQCKRIVSTALAGLSALALGACGVKDKVSDAQDDLEAALSDPELRNEAMTKLKSSMPEDLAIASNLDADSATSLASRIAANKEFFDAPFDSLTGVAYCLGALPATSAAQSVSPACYGPTLEMDPSVHPDQNNAGTIATGQSYTLPPGDLGLWTETEGSTGEACAAAKLNQLTRNSAWYVDLASGTMRLMVCVAAFQKDSVPTGGSLDMTAALAGLGSSDLTVTSALISNQSGQYQSSFAGTVKGVELEVRLSHNPTTGKGVLNVSIQQEVDNSMAPNPMPNSTLTKAVSVVYNTTGAGMKYRMITADINDNLISGSVFDACGEVKTETSAWSNNYNLVLADLDSAGNGELAYGWQAGAGDGFLRVFNVSTQNGSGEAWFGYSQNPGLGNGCGDATATRPYAEMLGIDGMICNWAGPGNQHTPVSKIQKQEMALQGGLWTPTASQILYAPANSCSVDSAHVAAFPSLAALYPAGFANALADKAEYGFVVPEVEN